MIRLAPAPDHYSLVADRHDDVAANAEQDMNAGPDLFSSNCGIFEVVAERLGEFVKAEIFMTECLRDYRTQQHQRRSETHGISFPGL